MAYQDLNEDKITLKRTLSSWKSTDALQWFQMLYMISWIKSFVRKEIELIWNESIRLYAYNIIDGKNIQEPGTFLCRTFLAFSIVQILEWLDCEALTFAMLSRTMLSGTTWFWTHVAVLHRLCPFFLAILGPFSLSPYASRFFCASPSKVTCRELKKAPSDVARCLQTEYLRGSSTSR